MRLPGLPSFRSAAAWHLARWRGWFGASPWNRRLVFLIVIYGVAFSVLTSLRILALSAFAWDLGIYNQAMYTTVRYGRFFYISGLPGMPDQSLFGGHFSPILFLLLPPYALFPSPLTLVIIQSWAVALAAAPVYRLAQRVVGSDLLAFAFALVFLLDPATQGVNWFDFHAEAFLLPTLLASLYFLEARRWGWFLVLSVLALATIEVASVLVGVVAIGGLASELWTARDGKRTPDRRTMAVLATLSVACIAWAVLAGGFVRAVNPQAAYFSVGTGYWYVLGAPNLASVPAQILLHPDRAVEALGYDGSLKLWYLVVLFAPIQLLTLKSPKGTLYCLPWLIVSLFSNFRPYYLVGNQYPSFVLPFVFYGAILGVGAPWPLAVLVRRLLRRDRPAMRETSEAPQLARVTVGLTLVLLLVVSPLGPWALGSDTTGRALIIGKHERAVLQLYALVPPTASILTQNNLYPLLSNRLNVHFVPVNLELPPGVSFNSTMNGWVSTVDYIFLDCQTDFIEAALMLSWPSVASTFSIVGAADGALLLERGKHNASLFEPLVRISSYQDVALENGTIGPDVGATGGYALFHPNGTTSHFWYGPILVLPPGEYSVSYRLKVDRASFGPLMTLPVILHPAILEAKMIAYGGNREQTFFTLMQSWSEVLVNATSLQGANLSTIDAYFTISTQFSVSTLGAYEFPGLSASGAVELWFDGLSVTQLAPSIDASISVQWLSA